MCLQTYKDAEACAGRMYTDEQSCTNSYREAQRWAQHTEEAKAALRMKAAKKYGWSAKEAQQLMKKAAKYKQWIAEGKVKGDSDDAKWYKDHGFL